MCSMNKAVERHDKSLCSSSSADGNVSFQTVSCETFVALEIIHARYVRILADFCESGSNRYGL